MKKEKISVQRLINVHNALWKKVPSFALKVQHVYQLLEWKWDGNGVPTVQEIRDTLYGLINDLDNERKSISTGGLCVWIEENEAGMDFTIAENIYN